MIKLLTKRNFVSPIKLSDQAWAQLRSLEEFKQFRSACLAQDFEKAE